MAYVCDDQLKSPKENSIWIKDNYYQRRKITWTNQFETPIRSNEVLLQQQVYSYTNKQTLPSRVKISLLISNVSFAKNKNCSIISLSLVIFIWFSILYIGLPHRFQSKALLGMFQINAKLSQWYPLLSDFNSRIRRNSNLKSTKIILINTKKFSISNTRR